MSANHKKNEAFDAYGAIARVYDRLNAEIDYAAWADFVEACFSRYLETKPELLLDLACGTGSMTMALRRRGYDMIGVDGSPDMLSVAYERAAENELSVAAKYAPPITQMMKIIHKGILSLPTRSHLLTFLLKYLFIFCINIHYT